MRLNGVFTFEPFTTFTAAKLFEVWMYQLMRLQFICSIEHFGHWPQTYGFTPLCRRKCVLRLPLWVNFFWQIWHVNQVPPLCDFSRCDLSWLCRVKRSEQWLHEYGFAPVWIRTWCFSSKFVLNNFTVRTLMWSSVAVYTTFMLLQVAGLAETLVTQWTLVWFVSHVDSHVPV